jgi:uncharacterized membrane protein HdeD (DUF308 family)
MQVAPQALRSYRSLFLVRGLLGILFGVLALSVSPAMTLLVLVYLFGAYALVGGIVAAALAFSSKEQGWHWCWSKVCWALPPSPCSSWWRPGP